MSVDQFNSIVNVLCLAFIHSLWQGLIMFILIWVSLRLTKNVLPRIRYFFLLAGVLIFMAAFGYTIFTHLHIAEPVAMEQIINSYPPIGIATRKNILQHLLGWCQSNSGLLMSSWSLFFLIKLALNVRALSAIRILKTSGLVEVDEIWKDRLMQSAKKMGILKIKLYQSLSVAQPVVVGWIKPMILVPLGFFNQLPPEEIEAILLHELAHIRRYDYLVNLLQVFVESIFFFNPFVLWISSQIRKEREFCCDQMAASKLADKKTLVRALLSYHRLLSRKPGLEMAFGSSFPLSQRAQRILAKPVSTGLKTFITVLILFSFMTLLVLTNGKIYKPVLSKLSRTTSDKPQSLAGFTTDTAFSHQVEVEKPENMRGSKKRTTPPVVNSSIDTIPKGASKEFIDGYRAGQQYRASTRAAREKAIIETQALGYMKLKPVPGTNDNPGGGMEEKRRLELRLQGELRGQH